MIQNTSIFHETARNIAMELVRDAIWDGDRCTWAGASMEPIEGKFIATFRSFKGDLYSGTAGIAFFLSAYYTTDRNELIYKTIDGALKQSIATLNETQDNGFYSGKAGTAYALIECGKNLNRRDLTEQGLAILEAIMPKAMTDHDTDIISGLAGTLYGVLYGYAESKSERLLLKAIKMGDMLCDLAIKTEYGWGWKAIQGKPILTGISHGIAGISCALLELFHATKDNKYLHAAMQGIRFEQSSFHSGYRNWPDFREGVPQDPAQYIYGVAWCTGAPGMALARKRSAAIAKDDNLTVHAEHAFSTTYEQVSFELSKGGTPSNFSICHGLGGNADILIESEDARHRNAAIEAGIRGIETYAQTNMPWPSGVLNKKKAPGLMLGTAGTGYFYLRLYDNSFRTILLPPEFS